MLPFSGLRSFAGRAFFSFVHVVRLDKSAFYSLPPQA
jgi:hypothetical protein